MENNFTKTPLGYELMRNGYLAFFGNKTATLEKLIAAYPEFQFRHLKQTHSDILIHSRLGSETIEADAHWTTEKNVALVIRTADCIPALLYDDKKDLVLAVHAGWRGLENQIILKSLRTLEISGAVDLLIGPHIRQNSFEIDAIEIKNQILASGRVNESDCCFSKNNKFYINLEKIFLSQAEQMTQPQILSLDYDTKIDLDFHSYRREKDFAGRNLSFITKLV